MKTYIVRAIALLLSILFIYAVLSKVYIFNIFVQQMGLLPLVENYPTVITVVFLLIEIVIAVILLLRRTQFIALYAAFFTLLFLTAFTWYIPHFYIDRLCSCIGLFGFTWYQMFIFNCITTVLTGTAITIEKLNKQYTDTIVGVS